MGIWTTALLYYDSWRNTWILICLGELWELMVLFRGLTWGSTCQQYHRGLSPGARRSRPRLLRPLVRIKAWYWIHLHGVAVADPLALVATEWNSDPAISNRQKFTFVTLVLGSTTFDTVETQHTRFNSSFHLITNTSENRVLTCFALGQLVASRSLQSHLDPYNVVMSPSR